MLLPVAAYETRTEFASPGAEVANVLTSFASEGFAVTAALPYGTQPYDYILVGHREAGATQATFETRFAQASDADLDTVARGLASDGYAVTAVASDMFSSYALFGVNPIGDSRGYELEVSNPPEIMPGRGPSRVASDPGRDAADLGARGFVITAVVQSATGVRLIGVKTAGSSETFDVRASTVRSEDITRAVAAFGDAGFVVTAAAAFGPGYMLVAARPEGRTAAFTARTEVVFNSPETPAAEFGAQGSIVQSLTSDGSGGFTLFGTSPITP